MASLFEQLFSRGADFAEGDEDFPIAEFGDTFISPSFLLDNVCQFF